ncbi:YwqJ-related putative deaminase [Streptomyces sp. PvR034]|uniref:YwqJ-related putative deaminase n=1 Tax=Streptomyces sp. PvR034 TaxID=3156401 RepID=UPI003391CDC8
MEPQPPWHGQSAGKMRHHRRDAVRVDHLDEAGQHKVLRDEARQLADDANNTSGMQPTGKDRVKQGCAGALLHDGVITSHTSSQKKDGQSLPTTHPVLASLYQDVSDAHDRGELEKGRGHGKCAEVSLVSDRLHALEASGHKITTPDEAAKALSGSVMHTVTTGDQPDRDRNIVPHGSYIPPCRSCDPVMKRLGIAILQ